MTKSRGFSIIEALVVLALLTVGLAALLFLGNACGVAGKGGHVQTSATEQALDYAEGMGYQNAHVQCVTWDSDGDGYVSCTVSFTQPNGTIGKDAVECAAGLNMNGAMNSGCRTPKMRAAAAPGQ